MVTTYYSKVIDDPKRKDYGEKRSLHRIVSSDTELLTETWNGEEWEHDSEVLSASGISGATKYQKIKESEVDDLKEVVRSRNK